MAGHGGGRLLFLDGHAYQWSVRGRRELANGHGYRVLTVVDASFTRQALHVLVRHDDPWLHASELARARSEGPAEEQPDLVTRGIGSGLVSRVVAMARAAGWDSGKPGPTLEFVLVDDQRLIPLAELEQSWIRSEPGDRDD